MTAQAAWAQLLSLGIVWVSIHCAGMCGPIVVGLDVGCSGRCGAGHGSLRVLSYQFGRAVTLATLGAIAGMVGAAGTRSFHSGGAILTGGIGLLMLAYALRPAARLRSSPSPLVQLGPRDSAKPRLWDTVLSRLRQLSSSTALAPAVAQGIALGLLPCGIVGWVLGLAATTASPLQGAAMMVVLVALTSPVLLGVSLLPRILQPRGGRIKRILPRVLTALSGLWMLLHAAAFAGWVGHQMTQIHLFGHAYMLMLW